MKETTILGLVVAASFACTPQGQTPPADPNEVEAAARAFQQHAHTFDYVALRAATTPDFEFLMDGLRMDLDGFEALLREMEESRGGRALGIYDMLDFNTEIVGEVAYTSWASTYWLESAVFIRSGDQWLVDRAFAVQRKVPEP